MARSGRYGLAFILGLLALYFGANILLRLFMPVSLELDEAEQAYYAQFLLGGYGPQPPFYNWLQYGIVHIFGLSVAALTVPKNVLLFLTYVFYGLAAREVLARRDLVVVAVLGLLTLPVVSFLAQRDLTHTVAVMLATTLFLYSFFLTINRPSLASFLLVGVSIGFGLIAKYNFAVLPAAAFIAVLLDPALRRRLLDWRIAATVAVVAVIVAPHLLWLFHHFDSASAETLDKMTDGETGGRAIQIAKGTLSLMVAILAFGALTVTVFAAIFKRALLQSMAAGNQWTRLVERMMIVSLLAVVAMIVVTGAFNIRERWLAPYLMVLPLYLCLKLEASGIDTMKAGRRMLPVAGLIMLTVMASLFLKVYSSQWTGNYSKLNVPFEAFSARVMAGHDREPVRILASDRHLAGSMRLQLPDVPFSIPQFENPEADQARGGPTLVVWRGEGDENPPMPEKLAAFLRKMAPGAIVDPVYVALPYNYGRGQDRYGFGFAWLPAN